jgi:hypothetical protein
MIMVKFNPKNKEEPTFREIFEDVRKITTKEEANQYLNEYAEYIQKLREKTGKNLVTGYTDTGYVFDATDSARHDIAYFCQRCFTEEWHKMLELFDVKFEQFLGNSYRPDETLVVVPEQNYV